jgi:eukaryotic-like serine/threonine-protein kinase
MAACQQCGIEIAVGQDHSPGCTAGTVVPQGTRSDLQPPLPDILAADLPAEDPQPEKPSAAPEIEVSQTNDTDSKRSGLKPLSAGTVLNNRYEIIKKIGGGGMGAVYLAHDKNLGVERAVKEMVQSSIEEDQQTKAIDDFRRESMILSTLDHPAIPTIYDYFYDDGEGRFYLVMKYISGGDLATRLRSAPGGRIDERTVTEWAVQIADVLTYLHGLPTTIVYRDLKPSNIMIDGKTDRIMLIDFGIARSIDQRQEKGVTAVGTMGYAPPELFSGQVEPRSDIYSLGSTMFHMLTGADPQNNPLLIFDFQKNPRPRQINPQLSDQMEWILMRAVEYKAESRFSSADEMRRTLAEHLENLRTGNVTYGVTEAPEAVSLANQMVFCGFCGQRIVASDMFCAFCGAKQPIGQQGVHGEIYSSRPASPTAKLLIEGTSELNTPVFSLEKPENLVGRRDPMSNIFPEVDLSRFDPQTKISRRHARIWRDGTDFMVEDLGSSNGTILLGASSNTIRLRPHQPHVLASGDRLRLGDTTLHFVFGN